MNNHLTTAVGNYTQGENVLQDLGPFLKKSGIQRLLILHGHTAFMQAGNIIRASLDSSNVSFTTYAYSGFCTEEDISAAVSYVQKERLDGILGVGGGKLMDFSKAVAAELALPVYLVPTVAATCAACAPLSVIYTPQGRQKCIRFFDRFVQGVWVDLSVLCQAPTRYLAAGIADAFAKSCEYSSMRSEVHCGDLETGMYMGYSMACAVDEVLLRCARAAIDENEKHIPGPALSDAIACSILFTGIVSSTGGFGGRQNARFKIAHGFNEIIRGDYVPDVRRWLHGEIVAVGILAQLRANGISSQKYNEVLSLFKDIHVPTTLSELGMDTSPEAIRLFTNHLILHSHTEDDYIATVQQAIRDGVS